VHFKVNFGQVTPGAFASSKRPYLSRFPAARTHPQHQPIFSAFRSKPHNSALSRTSLFCKKT